MVLQNLNFFRLNPHSLGFMVVEIQFGNSLDVSKTESSASARAFRSRALVVLSYILSAALKNSNKK